MLMPGWNYRNAIGRRIKWDIANYLVQRMKHNAVSAAQSRKNAIANATTWTVMNTQRSGEEYEAD